MKNAILDFNAADASVNTNAKAVGTASAVIVGSVASSSMVFAKDKGSSEKGIGKLFSELGKLLGQVYQGVDDVITGATVAIIGIGFLIRILSKNQRTVDEATTWIKRAILTLIVWKFLGLFMDTIDEASEDSHYSWDKATTKKTK